MKALVSGGAGFIGGHLCEALLDQGLQVVCADDFSLGSPANIAHLRGREGFTFYERDLADQAAADDIFENNDIGRVFHLAANSDIQASEEEPDIEYRRTYSSTFHILEAMRKKGVRRLFFASTGAVYGDKDGEPVAEDCLRLEPISYYGAAKLGAEALIGAYGYMNGMSSLIFRFPNVIGSRLTHGVIYDFIRKLRADPSRLPILGDGSQSKPYMHVSDLIRGILRFMDCPPGTTIYNIGVAERTSVTAIADIIRRLMGLKDVAYEYSGGRGGWRGDVPVFAYNLDKISRTGWSARYSSDEAVVLTVKEELGLLK